MRATQSRLHGTSIVGRARADPWPLLLLGLVVALATALVAAVTPLMNSASDDALADVVRRVGPPADVVATFPRADEQLGRRVRDPHAADRFRAEVRRVAHQLPGPVADVVHPGVGSITTPPLSVLGGGPGRYLSLAYVDSRVDAPQVHFVAGGPPRGVVSGDEGATKVPAGARSWPVQVAVSSATALAPGLEVGERVSAEDEQARSVRMVVSGIYVADEPAQRVWRTSPELLHPDRGVSDGVARIGGAALVSAQALPDLRLAVPTDDLVEKVAFSPRPRSIHWAGSLGLVREIGSLEASPSLALGQVAWDSRLDRVLSDGRGQVAAARAQAQVLLLGLLACVLLVLGQAAVLVVRRRAGPVVLTRERGGTLWTVCGELFVESALPALVGAMLGLLLVRAFVGDVGWTWWWPLPLASGLAAAASGVTTASRAADPRRVPANRSARLRAARTRLGRRLLVLASVVGAAGLTLVALRQRGVLGPDGSGDLTAATAPVWWVVAGSLVLAPGLPLVARWVLEATRRSTRGGVYFVSARLREAGTRSLPLVALMVTVGQLTFALALSSTEQHGQEAGALLSVGGDARATLPADRSASGVARRVAVSPGVRDAVAAHVEDGVRATSSESGETVRLVVVDARDYERLLADSDLDDAPQLGRLTRPAGDRVPALVLGGGAGFGEGLSVRRDDDPSVPLEVVGTAPRVQGSVDPVVVVDAARYAAAAGTTTPNTVWAVGPRAEATVRSAAGPDATVVVYSEVVDARRSAPLARSLVHLALASAALLMLLAGLAVAMGAATESGSRAQSLGRLRALGLRDGEVLGVLLGELAAPVCFAVITGLVLGVTATLTTFAHLSLSRITGQVSLPSLVLPWWGLVGVPVLGLMVVVLGLVEWTRLRAIALGVLLRA